MNTSPKISIVVPSFNQGKFIGETLQSLVDQSYPALEVIVQDGGSTDGSIAIATRFADAYPHVFQVFAEKDRGQADALNRGFARATGEIMGFLNSDDTLYPGCLRRVAQEIDPLRRRYVVFGRCLFTGEGSPYVGVEHPAVFQSHFEQLAIWKRGYNTIPQPSVFWHRRVWQDLGGFDPAETHVLDYDLFCRFSARYPFHFVDELWSTYRMHAASKSSQKTEAEVLDLSIAVSRRHWGPWWRPLRWRCEISHWLHRRDLHEHARHHARRAEDAVRQRQLIRAASEFVRTALWSPRVARERLLRAWLASWKLHLLESLLAGNAGFTGKHGDGWIGPRYSDSLAVPAGAKRVAVALKHIPQGHHQKLRCILFVNGRRRAEQNVETEMEFTLQADVSPAHSPCRLELRCDAFFIPREIHNTPDDRELSLQLVSISFH